MIISLAVSDELYAAYGRIDPKNPRKVMLYALEAWIKAKEPEYELASLVAHGNNYFDILFPARVNEVLHA